MNPAIDPETPVGQIARLHPEALDLFERFDIAYACKGARSLRAAVLAAGADLDEVLAELKRLPKDPRPQPAMAELVQTIVELHHRATAADLAAAAARTAGAAQSEKVRRIGRLLASLGATIYRHMDLEEQELFPRIAELESHGPRTRSGSISRALLVEFVEHDLVAECLGKMWELALQLTRDEDPDGSLFESLATLHRELNRHMHAENNVLIPLVIDIEARRKRTSASGELTH